MWAQSSKTLVKSCPTQASASLMLDLEGSVTVQEWKNEFIRIETTVTLENFGENILNRLIVAGRYEITNTNNDGKQILSMPKVKYLIKVQGQDVKEKISYTLFVPNGLNIEKKTPTEQSATGVSSSALPINEVFTNSLQ
jgi:hypothetical protein